MSGKVISFSYFYIGGKFRPVVQVRISHNIPLLGRKGFFNLFKSIKFREKDKFIDIEL